MPVSIPKIQMNVGKGIYIVEKARIDSITNNPLHITSKVPTREQGTTLWWALQMGNTTLSQQQTPKEWERSKAVLQQFAKQLYAQNIDKQVADAEKAVQNSQLESDKVIKQANEIQTRIAKNQQKKQELAAALAANAQELELLKQEVEGNLKQQEAAKMEIDNMRKAVELLQEQKTKR